MSKEDGIIMQGVREYAEEYPVRLGLRDGHHIVEATRESGYVGTAVDLQDLLAWVKSNLPHLWAEANQCPSPT